MALRHASIFYFNNRFCLAVLPMTSVVCFVFFHRECLLKPAVLCSDRRPASICPTPPTRQYPAVLPTYKSGKSCLCLYAPSFFPCLLLFSTFSPYQTMSILFALLIDFVTFGPLTLPKPSHLVSVTELTCLSF